MDVIKKMQPGDPGSKRLVTQHGEQLVCVRYRNDSGNQQRLTTVELVVDEGFFYPVTNSHTKIQNRNSNHNVFVWINFNETELRRRAKQIGGRWHPQKKRWIIRCREAERLGLKDRIEEMGDVDITVMHMNKTVRNSLLILVPSTLTFVVGWKFGALQGAGVSSQLSEAGKSSLIINELNMLREQKINELISLKEIQLDGALLSHSLYIEENNGWVIYPFNKMYEPILKKSLNDSVEYRKSNPRTETNEEMRQEMFEVYKRVDKLLHDGAQ